MRTKTSVTQPKPTGRPFLAPSEGKEAKANPRTVEDRFAKAGHLANVKGMPAKQAKSNVKSDSAQASHLNLEDAKFQLDTEKLQFERQKHMRERWWQEGAVISHRLNWLLASQAVLGGAYLYLSQRIAFIATSLGPNVQGADLTTYRLLRLGLPLAAFMCMAFIYVGIRASHSVQSEIEKQDSGGQLMASTRAVWTGKLSSGALAFGFVIAWAVAFFCFR